MLGHIQSINTSRSVWEAMMNTLLDFMVDLGARLIRLDLI